MDNGHLVSRRSFLHSAAVAGAAIGVAGLAGRATAAGSSRSVMGFKVPKMDQVRIGIIGIGMRGSGAVGRLLQVEGVQITALCDIRPECVARAQDTLKKKGLPAAKEFGATPEDWKRLAASPDVDLVYTCTPWELHTPICVHSMKEGKHAATEVPAAVTLDECWELVDTAEKTQRHCMMLENCCYGEMELLALNLCRQGILGELVHGETAYIHDLRSLKMSDKGGYQGMWRLAHSVKRNGNLYPTHGLGPIAQYMGINRGDRFDHLSSISSAERGLTLWAEKNCPPDDPRRKQKYLCGDMNTTVIRTCQGRTIMVQHDTTSPRPYTRHNLISGTKGILADYPPRAALDPKAHEWMSDEEFTKFREQHMHPLWKRVGDEAKKVGGHGGMDFIMDWRLIYCLRNGQPLDQDVYDAAAWSSVGPLSEQSVAKRGSSVDVPDFTRGVWEKTPPLGIVG